MTRPYLHTPALHVLCRKDLADLDLSPEEVIQLVKEAYLNYANGDSRCPTKMMMPHPKQERDATSISMLGYDSGLEMVGFKTLYRQGGDRPDKYYPAISLFDDTTGMPFVFMDCFRVGGTRTPATTAIIAEICAKDGARSALMIGTGGENVNTLPYLLTTMPQLETLRLFGTHPDGLASSLSTFSKYFPDRKLEIVQDVPEAVAASDIVVVASGRAAHPKVQLPWMKPGGLLISVSSKGVDQPVLSQADYVITTNAGQMANSGKRLAKPNHVAEADAELPEILAGRKPGRRHQDDRIFAFCTGMAIADIPVAHTLATRALAAGRGQRIELWS